MFKIVLDPGHGKGDNASHVKVNGKYEWVLKGFYEGNNNWEAVNLLKNCLEEYENVEVKLTKTTLSQNPSLYERGKQAWNADLFLSWHSNSSDDTTAKGVSVFYSLQRPNDKDLGKRWGDAVVKAFGSPTYMRGSMTRPLNGLPQIDWYGVLRNSTLLNGSEAYDGKDPKQSKCKHSLIVEHGFHTNPREVEMLNDPTFLAKLTKAEAEFIAKEFGLRLKKEPPIAPDDYYYFVTVSANKNKAYAEETLKKVKAAGFKDAYIRYCKR